MTTESASPKSSPRAERAVAAILESVAPGNDEAFKKALIVAMERYVEIKRAEVDFATVFAAGLEDRDPVKLMSAMQVYRDHVAEMLSSHDEHLGKVLSNRADEEVYYVVDRVTGGQMRRQFENHFHDTHMNRAAVKHMRGVAEDVIATRARETPKADVKRLLAEVEEVASTPRATLP